MSPGWRALLGACSSAGIWASVTMTGAYYGWWRGPARLVPARLCSTKAGGCLDILAAREARVLGPPNSSLGIAYYAVLLALSVGGLSWAPPSLMPALTALSWGVVAFSAYLAWALIFRLRTGCPICFFSHALNLGIALLLTLARQS